MLTPSQKCLRSFLTLPSAFILSDFVDYTEFSGVSTLQPNDYLSLYTITEVRTDDGYTLLKDNIKIVISQTETEKLCNIYASDVLGLVQNDPRYATIINDTGDLKNMPQKHLEHHLLTASATVDGNKVNMLEDDGSINASVPLKVVNTRGFDLPQTGDHGTWMFSVIGIMLMAGAAVVIIMTSRKKRTADQ